MRHSNHSTMMTNPEVQRALNAFLGTEGDAPINAPGEFYTRQDAVAVLTGSSSSRAVSWLRADGFSRIEEFALAPSAKRPRWVIPLNVSGCTASSLSMYVPFTIGAKASKWLLLAAAKIGWTGWVRHKVITGSRHPTTLQSLIGEITGETHPVCALSLGAPGQFRKLTIQVMRECGEILGFIKLPMTDQAAVRLKHEAEMLQYLSSFAQLQMQIPRVLYSGDWDSGYILFQSPGPSRPASRKFGTSHPSVSQQITKYQNH
jgi:hypothetical protein